MPFSNVNGIKIHYEVQGTGPRVLFIHGIGADLKNPIRIFDSPLAEHFTVLAFDPRGLGESDSPDIPCTIADMAEDAAALAKSIGWERYHVLGASMGGMVAQELTLHHPESVEKLVLVVTNAGFKQKGAYAALDRLNELPALEKLRLSDTRQDEEWAKANPQLVSRMEVQGRMMQEAMAANPSLLRGYMNQANAVKMHDTLDRLTEIGTPTLVLGGRFDGSNPPEIANELASRIPDAELELMEHGHGGWFFDKEVWKRIIEFLR